MKKNTLKETIKSRQVMPRKNKQRSEQQEVDVFDFDVSKDSKKEQKQQQEETTEERLKPITWSNDPLDW